MKRYSFPSFAQYDKWLWLRTSNHATREQYEAAKARAEGIVRKAEAI